MAPAAVPTEPQAPVSRAKKAAPEKPKRKVAPVKKVIHSSLLQHINYLFKAICILNQPIVEVTKVKVAVEDKGMSNPTPAMLAVMEKKQLAKTRIYGKTAESDNLTRDVQVVVERLENTPGYKKILVSREEVINIDYINIIDDINI